MALDLKSDEEEFYKTILHCINDILSRGVGNEDAQMKVDKEDSEEAETVASFAKKTEVFDKALGAKSTPPAERAPPQASEPSIPQAS